jgi:hypothetical protein
VVTQTVTQPSACKDRQGASPSVIQTGADQQDAAVTLNRACCCTPLTRCRGQHSGGGAFAPALRRRQTQQDVRPPL